jgi:hypothetical protein
VWTTYAIVRELRSVIDTLSQLITKFWVAVPSRPHTSCQIFVLCGSEFVNIGFVEIHEVIRSCNQRLSINGKLECRKVELSRSMTLEIDGNSTETLKPHVLLNFRKLHLTSMHFKHQIFFYLCFVTSLHQATAQKQEEVDCNPKTHYSCSDGSGCIVKKYLCNGVADCTSGEDETECG